MQRYKIFYRGVLVGMASAPSDFAVDSFCQERGYEWEAVE